MLLAVLHRKEVKVILRDQEGKEEKTADTPPLPSHLLVHNAMICRLFFSEAWQHGGQKHTLASASCCFSGQKISRHHGTAWCTAAR